MLGYKCTETVRLLVKKGEIEGRQEPDGKREVYAFRRSVIAYRDERWSGDGAGGSGGRRTAA
jgi:hypothetical protein